MELSKRLQAVSNLISKGMRVADVGTDHGYVPIYLIESGKCPSVIAMDINEGPLARAREHILLHGLSGQIITRRSDGVKALDVCECDCVIVAGMGGALAVRIMEEGREIFENLREFVLQPQSELEKVRQYLCEHEYDIIQEDMVFEDGKFYPMMKVVKAAAGSYDLKELRYGKRLLEQKHPILKVFLEKEIKTKEKILENLEKETGAHIEARRSELQSELSVAKEALGVYQI